MRPPNAVLRRILRGGRPVPLIAIVALLIGGAGVSQTAWAKALINGGDIKKGTVTGKQVKDGSIGVSDLARSARTELAGKPGPNGATGAAGPAGPAGTVGPAGPAGAAGVAGPAGPQGERGLQGSEGPRGAAGDAGQAGLQGERGLQGIQGEPGRDAASQWVMVNAAGQVVNGSLPRATAAKVGGDYRVTFGRDVLACGTLVTRHAQPIPAVPSEPVTDTLLDIEGAGIAYSWTNASLPNAINVRLRYAGDSFGAGTVNGWFTLALLC